MKQCPVCKTKAEDLYTGLCPNNDCPWEFEFICTEPTPEMRKRLEEKVERAKRLLLGRNSSNKINIDLKKAEELIESFISTLLQHTKRNSELGTLSIQNMEQGKSKYSKNTYYKCNLSDGKGLIVLHTEGDFVSQAFYVRKGIGYYYRRNFEKVDASLGLPISNEHKCGYKGANSKTDFENGFIEWVANEDALNIYVKEGVSMKLFDTYYFSK